MRRQGFSRSEVVPDRERALLVGRQADLSELSNLAETAGAQVVGRLVQKREQPDPQYFIGSGKLNELKALAASTAADLIIFDDELLSSQNRNLEKELGIKVLDRTELILDIFAQHARSREGRLQVELAQACFRLTHLTGHGVELSRLGGGIGTRGPGETKLEYDRRAIRSRIAELKAAINQLAAERQLKREKRRRNQLLAAAIIGYTNAGKSTLTNALTRSDILVEDKLFSTLDPTTRRLYLPSGQVVLVTDTVGFIQKLPHTLVTAFHATLEEVSEADILLHVIDASQPDFEKQIAAVYQVLEELNSITKPILTVFNKVDLSGNKVSRGLLKKYQPAVAISATKKLGLTQLLTIIDDQLPRLAPLTAASIPQRSPASVTAPRRSWPFPAGGGPQ